MSRRLWIPLAAALFVLAGCDVTSPDDERGATLTAAQLAPTSPGARIEARFVFADERTGMGVSGVPVAFAVVEGNGEVDPAIAVTDRDGAATTAWQLGSAVGTQTLAAEAQWHGVGTDDHLSATTTSVQVLGEANPFVQVATGAYHTCAITSGGVTYCWGSNAEGQLGTGSDSRLAQHRPVRLHDAPTFTSIAVGNSHACGISASGDAFCWGSNNAGQLGTGGTENEHAPVPVGSDASFASLALGQEHGCGLATDGTAYCWGSGERGRLGTGSEADERAPAPVADSLVFTSLAAGLHHTCGLVEDGSAYCWGLNDSFQLGTGSDEDRLVPTRVQSEDRFDLITAGRSHTCALGDAGTAYCWGSGVALGTGESPSEEPAPVAGGFVFRSLAAALYHTCAITTGGEAYCWGGGEYGQLGDGGLGPGHESELPNPVTADTDVSFTSVHSSFFHSCAVAAEPETEVKCWGISGHGQLGRGLFGGPGTVGPVLMPGLPE